MFDRAIEADPRPTPETRAPGRMRDGHRREYDAHNDRESISFPERCGRALADVGLYRCVSFRDLAESRFGGHPYTTRRAVNAWIREGLVRESRARGPKGKPFKVLTLTRSGAAAARELAIEHGLDPRQHIRSAARLQHAQLAHDTAIYRACGRERQRLLERGAAIRRVRLDVELKSTVARRGARPPHRRAGTCALPRCADRVHRLRRPERTHQRRGRLGPLPSRLRPGQGRCRVPASRERSRREKGAPGTRLQRRSWLHTRSGRLGSDRA